MPKKDIKDIKCKIYKPLHKQGNNGRMMKINKIKIQRGPKSRPEVVLLTSFLKRPVWGFLLN